MSATATGEKWSVKERLTLVSIMERFGESDWKKTARLLKKYCPESKIAFSHQSCAHEYSELVGELCPQSARRASRGAGELNLKYMISELTRQYIDELRHTVNRQREEFERCAREIERCARGDVTADEVGEMLDRAIQADSAEGIGSDDKQIEKYRQRLAHWRGSGGFWDRDVSDHEEAAAETSATAEEQNDESIKMASPTPSSPAAVESSSPRAAKRPSAARKAGDSPVKSPLKPAAKRGRPRQQSGGDSSPAVKRARQVSETQSERRSASPIPWTDDVPTKSQDAEEDIPVKQEPSEPTSSGPKLTTADESLSDPKIWKQRILLAWRLISGHRHANVFAQPVTEGMAKGYRSTVKAPMDLATIKRQVEHGGIASTIEFKRALLLMFANAVMFNSTGHEVFECAREMAGEALQLLEDTLSMDEKTAMGETAKLRRSEGATTTRRSLRARDA